MKYRVRIDLSFASEADAQTLMAYAKSLSEKTVSINEGEVNEEIAFCDLELWPARRGLAVHQAGEGRDKESVTREGRKKQSLLQ